MSVPLLVTVARVSNKILPLAIRLNLPLALETELAPVSVTAVLPDTNMLLAAPAVRLAGVPALPLPMPIGIIVEPIALAEPAVVVSASRDMVGLTIDVP